MLDTKVFWRLAGSWSKESRIIVILSLNGASSLGAVNILMY